MISAWQIVLAGLATAAAIVLAARSVGWDPTSTTVASALGLALVIVWRAAANLWSLNGDFVPTVSIGDAGCLPIGAIGPALVAILGPRGNARRWRPAVVGGVVAFVVNVVIL